MKAIAFRAVLLALAVSWLLYVILAEWSEGPEIAVKWKGSDALQVTYGCKSDVEWICSDGAQVIMSQHNGFMKRVEIKVRAQHVSVLAVGETEWSLIVAAQGGDGARKQEVAILNGDVKCIQKSGVERVRKSATMAQMVSVVAARRFDASVKGKRSLVGVISFRGQQIALHAPSREGWIGTPFEGSMAIESSDVLESFWRCLTMYEGQEKVVREALGFGIYGVGALSSYWGLLDTR